jgi:hypothetical protein
VHQEEDNMKTETRKLRENLTPAEREKAERIGALSFKSNRRNPYRMYVKVKYPGVGPKGRAA